eukprot:GFUD01040362.1.p1 GENE.GFUD01040362.1~~GFUD01040362.1.p1  ORF type:complete len:1387 (-),score=480.18 GFUD01040362.1:476-4636(-)
MPTTKTRIRTGSTDSGQSTQSTGSPAPARPDCPLFMECEEEELSEAQMTYYTKKKNAFTETMKKLEDLAKQGAKITANNDNSVTFQVTETTTTMGPVNTQAPAATSNQQYRFLMDPKTGRIIGSIPSQGGVGPVLPSPPAMVRAPTATPPSRTMTPRGRGGIRQPSNIRPSVRGTPTPPTRGRTPPASARESTTPSKSSPQVVDLTKPGVEPVGAQPIRKAFPALSVSAKPQRTVPAANAKRSELDAKVKGLLVHTPAKFTEWLIQQGLVRSEQYEVVPGTGKVKLKLGMYSDGKKFPHSGGYVWIQEGVSNKYTSVYKGSIFETSASSHPPTVLLKMIYHWSCQTNIPNVAQWVKVDNKQIDEFYQVLRSVCVAAVQDEVISLGGPGKVVEIGVISLGTTTADGQKREVRVEVLGVLDRQSRNLRLRATEPIQGANQAERFGKIFEPLPIWIHTASKIVTDFSVDKETLVKLGYKNVSQCSLSQAQSQRPETTNQQMMEYLKKVVPKMFQNTLSNLTTPVIQQFLDELTFRELNGQYPLACFDNLIQRISSQTASTAAKEDTMSAKLGRVAANPFMDWRYSEKSKELTPKSKQTTPVRRATPSPSPSRYGIDSLPPSLRSVESPVPSPPAGTASPTGTKRAASVDPKSDEIEESVNKRIRMAKELVSLESYYYCNLQGEDSVLSAEFKADMAFKCHVCKKLFMNNLEFMKHLHLHVETDRETAIDMADLTQCKYCYKDFDSEQKAQAHTDTEHYQKGFECVCLVCNSGFPNQAHLIHHMTKVHVKAEMPYQCNVCAHRSSQHRDIIEHFQETHDRTDKLQCPLCLKTYSLYGDKGYNSNNAVSFMQHLQKHEDIKTKSQHNCKKCVLKFMDEKSLKTHLTDDHVSFKDFDGIETYLYVATDTPIQMARPDEKQLKVAVKRSTSIKPLPQQAAFAAQNLEDMAIYGVIGDRCCECDRTMTMAGHYVAYLCCTKCRYSSCCAKAMSVHVQLFHAGSKPQFDLGKSVIMQEPMFCVCGYSAHSGNKLAKHLGSHGCKSAYPNLEEATKAKVEIAGGEASPDKDFTALDQELEKGLDPRISITEAHKSSEKAAQKEGSTSTVGGDAIEETAGPLAFLGLQRKESREDTEEKKDEDKDAPSNDVFEDIDKKTESDEKEEGSGKNKTEDDDDMDIDKLLDDVEEGDTSDEKNKEEENENAKKEPGMVLFGTMFKYMGEKKEGEKDESKQEESPAKKELDGKSAESPDKSDAEEHNEDEEKESSKDEAVDVSEEANKGSPGESSKDDDVDVSEEANNDVLGESKDKEAGVSSKAVSEVPQPEGMNTDDTDEEKQDDVNKNEDMQAEDNEAEKKEEDEKSVAADDEKPDAAGNEKSDDAVDEKSDAAEEMETE